MEGLPFLPGNSFTDPTQSRHHRSHTLGYRNGYALQRRPEIGIGGVPISVNPLNEQELDELAHYKPTLTYGQAKQPAPSAFVPSHVVWDKKVLRYYAWYKQTVHESPEEAFRVRHVVIYYYLEDDSISVTEPHVENSGLPQGKLIKRQRLPKNEVGDHWHWKDLNNGVNVIFYGKVFHIYDCDPFTKNFLESEGLVVYPDEPFPKDPYIVKRGKLYEMRSYKTPSDFDKLRQFLEMDRKVLRFYLLWDDRDSMFGELRKFILHYYLVDDTFEVREIHANNNGRDPFPVLITRHKVPKDRYAVHSTFPGIILELSDHEIRDYFTPPDLKIGNYITVYNRRFFIYDCDNFTKAFYWKNFGQTEFPKIEVEGQSEDPSKMEIPPYNGYGTVEDSLQSCLTLIPQPPKKDFIKMLENDGKMLRYECKLDSGRPEDIGRRFILHYRLADDMITVYEPPVRNSGIIGGKYLERTRIAKPGSTIDRPLFYGPQDFSIGAKIDVFGRRFVITGADEFVLKHMENCSHQYPAEVIESVRQAVKPLREGSEMGHFSGHIKPEDVEELFYEVKSQLKKLAIMGKYRVDLMFLDYDTERRGFLDSKNLRDMCRAQHLPCDAVLIDRLAAEISPNDPSHITLEDFRRFLETA